MLAIVTALLGAAEKVFQFLDTKETQKYINKCVEIKQSIKEEWDQWPNWDDSRIESLWKDLKIIEEALTTQLALYHAKK